MNDDVAFPPSPRPPRRVQRRGSEAGSPIPPPPDMVVVDESAARIQPAGRSQQPDFSVWKALSSIISVALVVATLFTMWMPENLFSGSLFNRMFQAVQPLVQDETIPTLTPSPRLRIGLVAGHWGHDPGAVCDDGLTEESVNLKIATLVQALLVKEGYDVDLLKEFDPRLTEYQAMALVSIHNDSCDFINAQATGFKVAAAASSVFPEKATRLTACMSQRYQAITGLQFHYNTVTLDMTDYHAFTEIHSDTTAAIIETGFLNLDRRLLTEQTDLVAQGVASGILCFVRNEDIPRLPTLAP